MEYLYFRGFNDHNNFLMHIKLLTFPTPYEFKQAHKFQYKIPDIERCISPSDHTVALAVTSSHRWAVAETTQTAMFQFNPFLEVLDMRLRSGDCVVK